MKDLAAQKKIAALMAGITDLARRTRVRDDQLA
jgi:hypothetical protein